jgi:hypothetical protein
MNITCSDSKHLLSGLLQLVLQMDVARGDESVDTREGCLLLTRIGVCVCVCVWVCVYMCVCIYIYIYIYIHHQNQEHVIQLLRHHHVVTSVIVVI